MLRLFCKHINMISKIIGEVTNLCLWTEKELIVTAENVCYGVSEEDKIYEVSVINNGHQKEKHYKKAKKLENFLNYSIKKRKVKEKKNDK